MKNFRKVIKEAVETKKPILGTFLQLPSPEIAEIFGYNGFDYVIIDNEHTANGPDVSVAMVRAAEASGTLAMIRTPDFLETSIKKALDTGASALLVPNVKTADDVRSIIRFAKYAPMGMRGTCPGVRANQYGTGDGVEFYQRANEYVAVLVQIETTDACDNIDEILDVEGLDAIWLGPVDLSMYMGHGGDANHPEVIAALTKVLKAAQAKGVAVAAFAMDTETSKDWIDKGLNILAYGIDGMILQDAAANIRKNFAV